MTVRAGKPCVVACACVALAAGACGSDAAVPSGAVVRDSADVTIMENRTPLWTDRPAWRVAPVPDVQIGADAEDPEGGLYRVAGAVRLPNRTIAVADGGTNRIRFYDPQGRSARAVGGRGEGPGEFLGLSGLHRFAGDSLMAFDSRLRRISIFDLEGRFVRLFRLERVVAIPGFPLADGRLAATTRDLMPREVLRTGVNHDSTTLVVFSMDGVPIDSVGRFPTPETFLWVDGPTILVLPYPFARRVAIAPFHGGFYFGASDAYEFRAYGTDGSVERIIRRVDALRPATAADVDHFRTAVLDEAQSDDHRRRLERILGEMSFRQTLPAFSAIVADAEGNLWVERYGPEIEDLSYWDVFDPDGRWLGTLELPPGLEVYEIGRDYLLAKREDALGVESVQLHRVERTVTAAGS